MMINILSIILLVFGVLQIILFFKLWGMTNDIKEIKEKYVGNESDGEPNKDKPIVEITKASRPTM